VGSSIPCSDYSAEVSLRCGVSERLRTQGIEFLPVEQWNVLPQIFQNLEVAEPKTFPSLSVPEGFRSMGKGDSFVE
jgi:hypothetical protein